jgi:hypothetical protein
MAEDPEMAIVRECALYILQMCSADDVFTYRGLGAAVLSALFGRDSPPTYTTMRLLSGQVSSYSPPRVQPSACDLLRIGPVRFGTGRQRMFYEAHRLNFHGLREASVQVTIMLAGLGGRDETAA